jgi:hypothetical protein
MSISYDPATSELLDRLWSRRPGARTFVTAVVPSDAGPEDDGTGKHTRAERAWIRSIYAMARARRPVRSITLDWGPQLPAGRFVAVRMYSKAAGRRHAEAEGYPQGERPLNQRGIA